jgi:hypothetical protein
VNGVWVLAMKSTDWLVQPGSGGIWRETTSAEKQREFVTIGLLTLSLVLLICLIARVQRRMRVVQAPHRPRQVFRSLLKHHGLGLSDRLLLRAIAWGQRVKQPTVLLLSPGLFSRHATQWMGSSVLAWLWPDAKGRLARIAQQVFVEGAGQQGEYDPGEAIRLHGDPR